jgi:Raf kinase inhibitor-like YbhB/YbcL family protein
MKMTLILESSAFSHQGRIPEKYTCESQDISPPLAWRQLPTGTQSLVLIVDDPDAPDPAAPKMTYVHWILYNLPSSVNGLPKAVATKGLPSGTLEGMNDWHRVGYGGPCPPVGEHRYFFKLYALDSLLPDLAHPSKIQLERAMKDHILEQTELMGTYELKNKNKR